MKATSPRGENSDRHERRCRAALSGNVQAALRCSARRSSVAVACERRGRDHLRELLVDGDAESGRVEHVVEGLGVRRHRRDVLSGEGEVSGVPKWEWTYVGMCASGNGRKWERAQVGTGASGNGRKWGWARA